MSKEEPKRFTSKIEITPVNPYDKNMASTPESTQAEDSTVAYTPASTPSQGSISNTASTANMSHENATSNERQIPIRTVNSNADTGALRMTKSRSRPLPLIPDPIMPVDIENLTQEIPVIVEKNQTRSPYDSPTMSRKQQPQVRHIPIFVEGRNEPVVSKDVDESLVQNKQFSQEQAPLKRKFDNNGSNKASASPEPNGQSQQKQHPSQKKETPVVNEEFKSVPQTTPPPKPKDPLERIQEVRQEVENLASRVEQYNGNSRADKEYLYLDEMLTRELIKLDTIEVEGNDNLRTARKDVIRTIQQAIALLESKTESKNLTETNPNEVSNTNSMEIDNQNKASNAESGPEENTG